MITAVFNHKGGSGKSTTAVNISAAIAQLGFTVLLVDMDAQGNATSYVGCKSDTTSANTIYNVLFESLDPHLAISETACPNLYCLPSSEKMINASTRLNQDALSGPVTKLYTALRRAKLEQEYDYIFLDCPSELDTVTANALNAAYDCIIPCVPDEFSLQGLVRVIKAIDQTSGNGCGTEIVFSGVVICNYRGVTKVARQTATDVFEQFPDSTYQTIIKQAADIPTSIGLHAPVSCCIPRAGAAKEYAALAAEYLSRHPKASLIVKQA